jgi:hypothetical protein
MAESALNIARQRFFEFETTLHAYDEGTVAFLQREIRRHLEEADEKLSALDPSLDPSDPRANTHIEERLQQAADRIRANGQQLGQHPGNAGPFSGPSP